MTYEEELIFRHVEAMLCSTNSVEFLLHLASTGLGVYRDPQNKTAHPKWYALIIKGRSRTYRCQICGVSITSDCADFKPTQASTETLAAHRVFHVEEAKRLLGLKKLPFKNPVPRDPLL